MLSLLYQAIIPAVGHLWLDDRFLLVMNCLLAFASLAGFERILHLFGLRERIHRLLVLLLLSVPHLLLYNIAFVTNPNEFNPTAIAKPLSIWVVYFAMCRGRQWRTVVTGLLLIGMSVRNAWMPCLLSLIVWGQRSKARVRWTVYGLLAFAPIAVLIAYRWFLRAGRVGHPVVGRPEGSGGL